MMKKLNKIGIGLLLVAVVLTSCDSLLDVKSERYVFPEDHLINSTTKALYGSTGLFYQLDQLADRYVLLGELRGDLMDVTEFATPDIKALNNFTYTADNPYIDTKDYYALINNCNYIINNIDTTIVEQAEKILYREYASTKAIRAWTYMQLALNFGKAKYYEEPILTLTDANKEYTEYTFDQLADVLIEDLLPWVNVQKPENISIGPDITSDELFFPVRFVLGELYLWKGQYENAAREFYELMYENEYVLSEQDRSYHMVENNTFSGTIVLGWYDIFRFGELENITMLAGSVEHGEGSLMDTLAYYNYEITPSVPAVENWESQTYYHSATITTDGDLRGKYGSYWESNTSDGNRYENMDADSKIIEKYNDLTTDVTKGIPVYRIGTLYLRYAEAVNRAGKPNLAWAAIKNGLSSATMRIDTLVPPSEKYSGYDEAENGILYDYMNFEEQFFDENIGIKERGCGWVHFSKEYVIPELASLEDSVNYVEEVIVDELARETAFEGNRFQDLMRVAIRRGDPSFLAKKVAAKHTENAAEIEAKLEDMNNWYLPVE